MTFRSLIPLIAAIAGLAVGFWAFASAVSAALDGSGNGSIGWQVLFFVALAVVIAAVVLSIVNLVKKRDLVVSILTIFVTAAPLLAIVIFLVAFATQGN